MVSLCGRTFSASLLNSKLHLRLTHAAMLNALQARFLSWEHLSREQIAAIRAVPKQPGAPTARQLLQQYLSEQLGEDQLRNDIVLDLFAYTLQQGQVCGPCTALVHLWLLPMVHAAQSCVLDTQHGHLPSAASIIRCCSCS
jgi:hypothetical protein